MGVAVICCKMIENEFKKYYRENALSCPVFFLDAGLHNYPDKLHKEIQKVLDDMPNDIDRVLLAYGLCGKAAIGLKSHNFEIVMPHTDDCIAFLLGSNEEKIKNSATYFVTEGWLSDEKSIFNEYKYALNKYGKEKSERILKRQFVNYKTLGIIDTGCYDISKVEKNANDVTELLSLTPKVIPTNCNMLASMLSPNFSPDKRFLRIAPNSEILEKYFFDFLN